MMEADDQQTTIDLKFKFPDVASYEEFAGVMKSSPNEFRMAFNDVHIANLSAKVNIESKQREEAKALPISSPEVELAYQKQREISKLEEGFLEALSPNIEKRRDGQVFTPVFSVSKTETVTTIDLTEKSPPRTALAAIHLSTRKNNHPLRTNTVKSALEGVFDLHETINIDCDLNQTRFTSCHDDFVAGQLECQFYEEVQIAEQPPVAQAPRKKRTIEEMDRLLKSVFEENDDNEVLPCRAPPPVVKAASLRDSAKFLSKPNVDLQRVVDEIIRPSYERASVTATRQLLVTQEQPSKNPYEVVQIHEAVDHALRKNQETNQNRFQRDLNKSLQAPLRPFNAESRNLNSICTASTNGRVSLEVKATVKNTSNGVQVRESQLKKLREVFTGGKCPDELMSDFQLKF